MSLAAMETKKERQSSFTLILKDYIICQSGINKYTVIVYKIKKILTVIRILSVAVMYVTLYQSFRTYLPGVTLHPFFLHESILLQLIIAPAID
jgi:hypothetical protein